MSRRALGRGLDALFTKTAVREADVVDVDIDLIDRSAYQPRQVFKEKAIEELASSIKANGILQPIIVRRVGDRFQIIAGERRWRAAQRAGLQRITCVIRDAPDQNLLELSLIENIQREELNPIEEAAAYRRLVDELSVTQEEVARRVGKDRSSVTNSLRLLRLPREVQRLVEDEKLSMGHARALLAIGPADRQKSLAAVIVARSLSVRETETLIKRAQSAPSTGSQARKAPRRAESDSANILAAESKLSRKLAAPVRIKLSQGKGVIEIKFSSTDDLTRIYDLLARIPPAR
ncbi:MAG TPA: ParB/RepB/Spo0J family partition protein [Blastocatellia bacterium]|nr:ParB/RepB/Spo0J family partition protein [Blastocatellia bacterium]